MLFWTTVFLFIPIPVSEFSKCKKNTTGDNQQSLKVEREWKERFQLYQECFKHKVIQNV